VGQPQLRALLRHPDLLQFQQRVSVDFHLQGLNEEETRTYIFQRLKLAGRKEPLFTRNAINLIYEASGGIPRVINTLCDTSLVYGFADQKPTLDSKLVAKVLKDKHAAVSQSTDIQDSFMDLGQHQPGANGKEQRVTNFNRDSAKLLFKKYYNEK
jgi:hypothetical protein